MIKFIVLIISVYILQTQAIYSSTDKNGRIVGGETTYAGAYPFIVAIYRETATGTYFCAGSLITNQWVITAGQCVVDAVKFTLRMGSHSLSDDNPNTLTVISEEYVLHPDFSPSPLDNDIALIKTLEPVELTDYIRTVIYNPPTEPTLGRPILTAGWGQVNDDAPGIEDVLRWVSLVPLSNAACKITYGNVITDNMLCAAGNFNEGLCRGDVGGPLFRTGLAPTYLDGIASFFSSRGCDNSDPSGYTRVSRYVDWIINITLSE